VVEIQQVIRSKVIAGYDLIKADSVRTLENGATAYSKAPFHNAPLLPFMRILLG
jgi:hypothetical protein